MIRIGLQSDRLERTGPGLRAGAWIETYKDLAQLGRRVATEGPTNDLSGACFLRNFWPETSIFRLGVTPGVTRKRPGKPADSLRPQRTCPGASLRLAFHTR